MPRRSKWEKFKPEVMRLYTEGLTPSEVLNAFEDRGCPLPSSTVYDWHKEYRLAIPGYSEKSENKPDSTDEPIKPPPQLIDRRAVARVTPDPESHLQRIINAMWDVYEDPTCEGASIKVQVLNSLLKAEQFQASQLIEVEAIDDQQPDLYVEVTAPNEATAA